MKCEFCAKGLKWTFNMNNRCCQVKWLRAAHKPAARQWLKAYKAEHGEAAMLELIAEVNDDQNE